MWLAFFHNTVYVQLKKEKKKTAGDMRYGKRQMARLEMSDTFHFSYFSQRVFVMKIWFVSRMMQFFSLCVGGRCVRECPHIRTCPFLAAAAAAASVWPCSISVLQPSALPYSVAFLLLFY
jgi:hypothetical protein